MIIHRGLQALLLKELVDVAFVFLIDFLEAVEFLLLKLTKALFLTKSVVFRGTEVFGWPKSCISHFEGIVASNVFVGVWNCFIQILVDESGVFFFVLFLCFYMLLQKEILLQDLLVKSQNLFCQLLVLTFEFSQLCSQVLYLAFLFLIRSQMPINFLLLLLYFVFFCS